MAYSIYILLVGGKHFVNFILHNQHRRDILCRLELG